MKVRHWWSRVFIISIILSAFFACNETIDADDSAFGYDFFPLETGEFRVYDVKEIIYPLAEIPDTLIYQLKEVTADSLIDNAGETNYVLQRWKRNDANDLWVLDSLWTTYKNDMQAVIRENNIPLLKLVFPFEEEKSWDSNSLNFRDPDEFVMRDLFMPYSDVQSEFSTTVTVIQEEKLDSLISLDNRYEVFARDVGLIAKVSSKLEFCQESDCFGQKIIKEGRILSQSLIDYGKE